MLSTPWNFIPVQVTEDVTVIANMEYGGVGKSQYGVSVVVSECSAQVSNIVSATFYVPSMNLNGYYDRLQYGVKVNEQRTVWKKCNCSHHESEHTLQKNDFSEPRAIPEMELIFTHDLKNCTSIKIWS